ncbi:MAG TPA: DNA-binding protein [Marinilabiliales bacterium]|nr:MAG: DNA-binding protein [Bacteroidetes bacterium GWC2_40_13]OFX71394.1 MAG: DNA-binding protein [Bacteroidetes bacterium GWD2_40_43]OFX91410.1 MAG: DNA-binding protein [Bacteroidetes bacterium GWE2_40_63]OFY19479.1 MAG: DNA-binding protein [Bacteroidetes bacterium GWF2_40_13]OFZ25628.1 MAG: DNA-binding protein [Bacteroidetes bacterium RIFOXYC2_FULL_40_12]HAM97722.1 DNA-binding protein [Marinilabiliales bacterium]
MQTGLIHTKNKLDESLLFKISRFKEKIKKTSPHKHDDYYELIFLSEGEGFHWIETEKYMISAPEFYFLKPGQLHYWQFTSIPKGYVILFRADFFDNLKETDIINLYRRLTDKFRVPVPDNYNPEAILNELLKEYSEPSAYSSHIIHGYLRALFAKILQLAEIQSQENNVPISVYEKFQDLLVKECPRLHKVNDFAGLLNTTPQNLNTVCRKHSGKSASEHITFQLLLEAKRYILHTENTINEIAYTLSFNDPSNFVKFFRKHENLTPVQFREKYFQ